MHQLVLGTVAAALAAWVVGPAGAQTINEHRAQCEGRGTLPDLVIAGCTAMIQMEREPQANRVVAFNNRGLAHARKRDDARAIADYDEAIRLGPQYALPFSNRGDAHTRQGDFTRAISDFDQAIRIDPQYAPAFFGRALAYHRLSNFTRAIADYDEAIRLDPQTSEVFKHRGDVYYDQGEYARAIADYDQAIRLEPGYARAFNNRGAAYAAQRDYARAIADQNQAIQLDAQLAQAFLDRGDAYSAQRDYVRAIADYHETIRLDPKSLQALVNRAVAYAAQRDYARAVADFDSAGEIDPANGAIHNSRCWNRAVAGLQLDNARAVCDRAISLAANDAQRARFLDTRGFLALKQSRWEDAWADYDAALRQSPGSAHYRFGRGIAARRLGRAGEAEADLARAAQIDSAIAQTYAAYGVTP